MKRIALYSLLAGATILSSISAAAASAAQQANFPIKVDYGWWTSAGQTSANSSISGPKARAHTPLDRFMTPNTQYVLKSNAVVKNTLGTATYAVFFFDKDWKSLGSVSEVAKSGNVSLSFVTPANAAHVRLQMDSDRLFDGSFALNDVTIDQYDVFKLRYAPPALTNPITLELGTGYTSNMLDVTKDYIIKLPKTKKIGSTFLIGGRNLVIIGGHITVPLSADLSNKSGNRAIYIKDNKGTVHIEGVLIDASGGAQSDAIAISSPDSIVQIENVRVEGIFGFYHQLHADVIQPFGGVKELRVDRLTGFTGYQGLQIDTNLGVIGSAKLENINLESTGAQIWGNQNNGGVLAWFVRDAATCANAYPISLKNVYLKPRADRQTAPVAYPPANSGKCSAVTTNGQITYPSLPITGSLTLGTPPKGDFVPTGVAGLNYVPAGYNKN